MAKLIPELSVFFPAYNEEKNIKNTVEKAKKVLQKIADKWEIIIVDDGSNDKTGEIANELSKNNKNIRVIHHNPNRGYGAAFKSGLFGAKYKWITFTDSDGQFNFSEITNFISKQKETSADIVIGYYKKRQVKKSVILTSKLWEALVYILFGLKAKDIDCGFKLISKKVPDKLKNLESERGAFISSEFLIKAKREGFKIVEIPVTHYPRASGNPTGRNLTVIFQSFIDLFKLWLNKETILMLLILVLGAFLRLYKIGGYMTFLGDEGRDAIIVRRLLVNFDPILIGPGTSIGNMYLGPLYYYLIAPFLLVFNLSPIGPSIEVALLGVATIFLLWKTTKEWFGEKSALIVSFLYAISPTIIIFSRSSWNPNVMPFFALLTIYSIWKIWQENNFKWFIVLAVSYAMVLNSHYLGFLLAPVILIFYILTFRNLILIENYKLKIRNFTKYTLYAAFIFAFLMSPLVIFDFRHNFINFHAFSDFFLKRQTTVSARPWNAIPQSWPLWKLFTTRILAGRNEVLGSWLALGLLSSLFIYKKSFKKPLIIIFVWLGFAILGLGIYKQHIYDHYFGFFFPAMFLLLASIFQYLLNNFKLRGSWIVLFVMIFLTYFDFLESPIKNPPNNQMQRAIDVASLIRKEAENQKFNLAVIAEQNYEDGYQYFLEKWHTQVTDIDPLNYEATLAQNLFVVCEVPKEKCDPTHSSKAEVANFGWSQIDEQWTVDGTIVYKLSHVQNQ